VTGWPRFTPVPGAAMEEDREEPGMSTARDRRPGPVRLALAVLMLVFAAPGAAWAGILVNARCPCGYHREHLPIFGGRANFRTTCRFPALCRATRELVLVNILDPLGRVAGCPDGQARRYDDPSLAPTDPGAPVAVWNLPGRRERVTLFSGGYVCPRCGRRTLRFTPAGFWD